MPKTFYVSYKLYGTIQVEAENEEQARENFNPSDEELIEGISSAGIMNHPEYNIDSDSIEVYDIQEAEVEVNA